MGEVPLSCIFVCTLTNKFHVYRVYICFLMVPVIFIICWHLCRKRLSQDQNVTLRQLLMTLVVLVLPRTTNSPKFTPTHDRVQHLQFEADEARYL